MQETENSGPGIQTLNKPAGNFRWVVVTLLFFATTINYMDRQVIGLLKDNLAKDFNWSEKDYSRIVMAFTSAYALALLIFGRLIDKIGTKLGYAVSVVVWSIAAMCHAIAGSTLGFGIARTALGLGEGGNFPAAIKAIAEWFPQKDRALATGIFNSGTNVASIIGPPAIAWIFINYGWKEAFVWTGALGFIWLIAWIWLYRDKYKYGSMGVWGYGSGEHVDQLNSSKTQTGISSEKKSFSWWGLFRIRQTWTIILGKFLTDPIWWFYLFWIPSYFNTTYNLNIARSAIHVSTVYVVASFGSILGGYLSGWLIKKGLPVYKARKYSMLLFACCVVPIFFVRYTNGIWPAVWLISLAAAAHQAWSANIFTLISDMFPKHALSSMVGIGGMAGSVGGILFPFLIGIILDHFKLLGLLGTGYNIIFGICAAAYLLAWVVMQLLSPKMREVNI